MKSYRLCSQATAFYFVKQDTNRLKVSVKKPEKWPQSVQPVQRAAVRGHNKKDETKEEWGAAERVPVSSIKFNSWFCPFT